MGRTGRILAAVAATLMLVAGCSGGEPGQDGTLDTGADPDTSRTDDSGAVGSFSPDPADVIAEVTYTLPGTEDEVTVGVLPVEVDGDVMTLWLAFTPNFASEEDDALIGVNEMYPNDLLKFRPVLVDRLHLKEYSLISDTGLDWAARTGDIEAVNGGTVFWWGVYAAPEDGIETIDIRLRDGLPEFTAVPVG